MITIKNTPNFVGVTISGDIEAIGFDIKIDTPYIQGYTIHKRLS